MRTVSRGAFRTSADLTAACHPDGDADRQRTLIRPKMPVARPSPFVCRCRTTGWASCGSILIETMLNWPGSGFLLSNAIFQRDLPLLKGTILILALFFVAMNLIVDVAQAATDPRPDAPATTLA